MRYYTKEELLAAGCTIAKEIKARGRFPTVDTGLRGYIAL